MINKVFDQQHYHFVVEELPKLREALGMLQKTGLDWLDSILKEYIVSTITAFEDVIEEYEYRQSVARSEMEARR